MTCSNPNLEDNHLIQAYVIKQHHDNAKNLNKDLMKKFTIVN